MRCVRGAKESADVPGQHASGREALASRGYICGTGPRPPLAASCVPSTWYVAAYGHVQEQHVPTRQEKRALLPPPRQVSRESADIPDQHAPEREG